MGNARAVWVGLKLNTNCTFKTPSLIKIHSPVNYLMSQKQQPRHMREKVLKEVHKLEQACSTKQKEKDNASKPLSGSGRNRARKPKVLTNQVDNLVRTASHRNPGNGPKVLQNNTGNVVSRDNPINAYIKTLIDPQRYIARIPDAFDRPTALFRSIGNFNLPISMDNVNAGRFSFALQPKFGDISSPEYYQAAVADPVAITASGAPNWQSVDWSRPSMYMTSSDMGRDPRVDINAPFLVNAAPSYFGMTYSNATPDLTPKILFSGFAANQSPFADNTPPMIQTYSAGFPGPYVGTSGGILVLPFGEWAISVSAKFQMSSGSAYVAINNGQVSEQALVSGVYQPQTIATTTGVDLNASAFFRVISSPNKQNFTAILAHAQSGTTPNGTPVSNCTVSSTTLVASPADFATNNAYQSGGVISEVRPVAMACLATYMGTTLNNGGEIAISYVPYQTLTNNYFQTNAGGGGQMQLVENLRGLNGAYDGPIKDGAYCFWTPYSGEDSELVSPERLNSHQYPSIICSGNFMPDTTFTSLQPVIRVQTFIVFEFVTKYTMYESIHLPGSQSACDAALNSLRNQPYGCANNKHVAWIKSVLQNAGKFYAQNAHWLNPAAGALAALI